MTMEKVLVKVAGFIHVQPLSKVYIRYHITINLKKKNLKLIQELLFKCKITLYRSRGRSAISYIKAVMEFNRQVSSNDRGHQNNAFLGRNGYSKTLHLVTKRRTVNTFSLEG